MPRLWPWFGGLASHHDLAELALRRALPGLQAGQGADDAGRDGAARVALALHDLQEVIAELGVTPEVPAAGLEANRVIAQAVVLEDLDLTGLDVPVEDIKELLRVDVDGWKEEAKDMQEHFSQFGDRLPQEMAEQLKDLIKRLEG